MSKYDNMVLGFGEGAGIALNKIFCLKPTDGSGDFDVVRPTIVNVNQNGIATDIPVDVPAMEWEEGECPHLLTGVDDRVTDGTSTFDSSEGVFSFEGAVFKDAVLKSDVVLFSVSNKKLLIRFNENADTVSFEANNGGTISSFTLNLDYAFRSLYQIGWSENDLTFKINTVLVYQQNTFATFGAAELTTYNLCNTLADNNFLLAKTYEVNVSNTKSDIDANYQTIAEIATALTQYNAYTRY